MCFLDVSRIGQNVNSLSLRSLFTFLLQFLHGNTEGQLVGKAIGWTFFFVFLGIVEFLLMYYGAEDPYDVPVLAIFFELIEQFYHCIDYPSP